MSPIAVVLSIVTTDTMPARGSKRSRGAAAVSGLTLRQISAVLPPERAWGLWASRRIVARIMDSFGPSLAGTEVETVDVAPARRPPRRRRMGARRRACTDARTQCIYFLHGSGFALCSPRTHRRLTAWLSRLTGLPVFCVDYRLAPRHRFPTAAVDVRVGLGLAVHRGGLRPGPHRHRGRLGRRAPRRRPAAAARRRTPGRAGPVLPAARPDVRARAGQGGAAPRPRHPRGRRARSWSDCTAREPISAIRG